MNTHLKGFGLENFRVFKDYTWFDFAPITILTGPNNSGKSSLIKALLLTEENTKQMLNGTFVANQGKHNLGIFVRMLNDTQKDISFELPFELRHIPRPLDYQSATLKLTYKYIPTANSEHDFSERNPNELAFEHLALTNVQINVDNKILIEYGNKFKNAIYFDKLFFLSLLKPIPDGFITFIDGKVKVDLKKRVSTAGKRQKLSSLPINAKSALRAAIPFLETMSIFESFTYEEYLDFIELYNSENRTKKSPFEENNLCEIFNNTFIHPESPFNIDSKWNKGNIFDFYNFVKTEQVAHFIHRKIFPFDYFGAESINIDYEQKIIVKSDLFPKERISYLTSQRPQIKRIYTNEDDNSLISDLIKFFDKKTTPFIKKWSSSFNLTKEIEVLIDDEFLTKALKVNNRPLVELGYGISQLTILLLSICGSNNNAKTMILEEPEANLHPNFQSKLADMFSDAVNVFNQQYIIETHSEYIIRKFQYLVAKGEMDKEDIVIYYFHDPNNVPAGEPQVKKIEILADGSLSSDFGSGFFDEATNWKFELMRLKNAQNN